MVQWLIVVTACGQHVEQALVFDQAQLAGNMGGEGLVHKERCTGSQSGHEHQDQYAEVSVHGVRGSGCPAKRRSRAGTHRFISSTAKATPSGYPPQVRIR
ncbi:hypothetical protein D3C72_2138050 [compost metagenome]